ncbi:MAG: DUF4198 domain-containing protein [Clostridia bacterium]|nr:DUF4198 domain-containing protein [Clostridia bacterium]
MQNTLKRIVICLLVVAICCGFALFAVACDKDQNKGNTNTDYVVKVQDENGTAVSVGTGPNGTLLVQLCNVKADGEVTTCSNPKAVDQSGTATFKASELTALGEGEKYHVVVTKFTDDYACDEAANEVYMSEPGTATVTLKFTTEFKATVLYDTDKALVGEKFEIYYVTTDESSTQSDTLAVATTDANGVASFKLLAVSGVKYNVRQSAELSKKYELDAENSNATFGDNHTATLKYKFYPNAFPYGNTKKIDYSREAVKDGEPKVTNHALELTLKSETYEYFYFNPFVQNPDFTAEENAAVASGVYKISFTVEGNADVTMKYFAGNCQTMTVDENKIPLTTLESVQAGGYVELELSAENDMNCVFGFLASADCKVTVSVERTGDYVGYVAPTPVVSDVQAAKTPATVGNDDLEEGTLTVFDENTVELPMIMQDVNGVYHVGAIDGPILYAVLKQPVDWFWMEYSFDTLVSYAESHKNDKGEDDSSLYKAIFIYATERDDHNMPTKQANYLPLMKAYCTAAANTDGLYPLNDELKGFLEKYASQQTMNADDYIYGCVYFAAEGDEPGNENALNLGDNNITIAHEDFYGFVNFTFTSEEGGWFEISTEKDNLYVEGPNGKPFIDTGLEEEDEKVKSSKFQLQAGATIRFSFSYSGSEEGDATILVKLATTEAPQPSKVDVEEGGEVDLSLDKFYVLWASEGMYKLSFDMPMMAYITNAQFELEIDGRTYTFNVENRYSALIVIASEDIEEVSIDDNKTEERVEVIVSSGFDGKVPATFVSNSDEDFELTLGENSFYLLDYNEIGFTFTAVEAGWYEISSDKAGVYVEGEDDNDSYDFVNDEQLSGKFYLEADAVMYLYVNYKGGYDYEFVTLTLATTEAPVVASPSTITVDGGEVNFKDFDKFYFEVADAGTYNFTLDADAGQLTIKLNGQSYTFTPNNGRSLDIEIAASDINADGKVEFEIYHSNIDKCNVTVELVQNQDTVLSATGGAIDLNKGDQTVYFECATAGTYTFTINANDIPTGDASMFWLDITVGNKTTAYTFKKFPAADNVKDIVIEQDDIVEGKVTLNVTLSGFASNNYVVNFTIAKVVAPTEFTSNGGTLDLSKGNHTLLFECAEEGTYTFTLNSWNGADSSDMGKTLVTLTLGSNSHEFKIFPIDSRAYDFEIAESDINADGKVEFQVVVGDLTDNNISIGFGVELKPSDVTLLGTWQAKSSSSWDADTLTLVFKSNGTVELTCSTSSLNGTANYTGESGVLLDTNTYHDDVTLKITFNNGKLYVTLNGDWVDFDNVKFTKIAEPEPEVPEVTLVGDWKGTITGGYDLTVTIDESTITLVCGDSSYNGSVSYTNQTGTLYDNYYDEAGESLWLTLQFNNGQLYCMIYDEDYSSDIIDAYLEKQEASSNLTEEILTGTWKKVGIMSGTTNKQVSVQMTFDGTGSATFVASCTYGNFGGTVTYDEVQNELLTNVSYTASNGYDCFITAVYENEKLVVTIWFMDEGSKELLVEALELEKQA